MKRLFMPGGTTSAAALEASMPVLAKRLKFHGTPCFESSSLLPRDYVSMFNDPKSNDIPELEGFPPRAFIHGSRTELLKLLSLMALSRRLLLVPSTLIHVDRLNGLHVVAKEHDYDRLIVDARPSNFFERRLAKWTKLLVPAIISMALCLLGIRFVRCFAMTSVISTTSSMLTRLGL